MTNNSNERNLPSLKETLKHDIQLKTQESEDTKRKLNLTDKNTIFKIDK